jgi:hypothetical protein
MYYGRTGWHQSAIASRSAIGGCDYNNYTASGFGSRSSLVKEKVVRR